jgi:AGZA family xanthine/uracil permease-like MFS transporter
LPTDAAVATSPRTEVVAGLTTFLATAYIVAVNPAILTSEGTGMPFTGVLTATVLLCFVMTLLMGVLAKLPFAVAPGMGLNAFFAYTLVIGQGVPWPVALGMVFWAGVLFVGVSVTPVREWVAEAIPASLRTGMAAGIGLLLTFIGLRNAGLVVASPTTMVAAGPLGHEVAFAALGLVIAVALLVRRQATAYLVSIAAVSVAAWAGGYVPPPAQWVSAPDFTSAFLQLDVVGALHPMFWSGIVALLFTDLFDSLSTFLGVSQATGFTDAHGRPVRMRQGLLVDALATLGAGLLGTSPGTAYVESAAGIEAGGRTGLTSVVTALCFLPCLFLAPLVAAIPSYATAPVLVLVGLMMFGTSRHLPFGRLEAMVPAFLTLILIPLTLSITQGLLWGLVAHAVVHVIAGRAREVGAGGWTLAVVAGVLLALHG